MNASLHIREAEFATEEPAIRAVRFEVFVDEQRVPPEIEMDDRDPHCIHLLAYSNDKAVGTARIDIEQAGKVGRLAVLADYRQRGIGRALMERCHAIASSHGLTQVYCHAQVTAIPFYRALGYAAKDATFEEAGIDHREMTLSLT